MCLECDEVLSPRAGCVLIDAHMNAPVMSSFWTHRKVRRLHLNGRSCSHRRMCVERMVLREAGLRMRESAGLRLALGSDANGASVESGDHRVVRLQHHQPPKTHHLHVPRVQTSAAQCNTMYTLHPHNFVHSAQWSASKPPSSSGSKR
jgi:hypothetical protein